MYHSITFGEKNTWDDWHLIPASRPRFEPPPVKSSFIDIPGGDGSLDLSTALTGQIHYNNRTGKLSFIVANDYKDWTALYTEIMMYLHGRKMRAVLEDDPGFYYEGRFAVNTWESNAQYSTIVINYNVSPYKRDLNGKADDDWLWDPFNFETGIIRHYNNRTVNGTLAVTVYDQGLRATLKITSSVAGMTVKIGSTTYTLSQGVNVMRQVTLAEGENTLTFTGNGVISVDYDGGWL